MNIKLRTLIESFLTWKEIFKKTAFFTNIFNNIHDLKIRNMFKICNFDRNSTNPLEHEFGISLHKDFFEFILNYHKSSM